MRTAALVTTLLALAHLGAVFMPAVGFAALPETTLRDAWVEVRTARFRVLSNANEPDAIRAARELERLAEVLTRTTVGLSVDGGREIRVYIFRDQSAFRSYSPFTDDEHGSTAGFHTSSIDAEFIAYFIPQRGSGIRFAAHEYLHAVLARSVDPLPVWANEGIAEYYSTFETDGRTARLGYLIRDHVLTLRDQLMSWQELLAMAHHSPEYREGARRGTIYAQSWGLIHSLAMDRADNGRRFGELITALGRGAPTIAALQSIYGPGAPDSLLDDLRSRARHGVFPSMHASFAEDFATVPIRTRTLDRVEVLTVLGELAVQSTEHPGPLAREHLTAAWSSDSTRALPAALLGQMAEHAGDRAEASRWFSAVRRLPANDSRASGIAGNVLAQRRLRSGASFHWPGIGPDSDALEARALLRRALELRPNASEWLVPFAHTYLDDAGDSTGVQEAIGALLTAQETWPRRSDIVGGLAVLQARAGNRSASMFLYRQIPPGPSWSFWRNVSGYLILESALEEASQHVQDGRHAEAESLVSRVCGIVTGPGIASRCDGFLGWARDVRSQAAAADSASSRRGGRTAGAARGSPAAAGSNQLGGPGQARAGTTGYDLLAQASRSLATGDYESAERLIAKEVTLNPRGSRRARLDSLAAHARSIRRLDAADALMRRGLTREACALLDLILRDHPPLEIRRRAGAKKSHICRS